MELVVLHKKPGIRRKKEKKKSVREEEEDPRESWDTKWPAWMRLRAFTQCYLPAVRQQ